MSIHVGKRDELVFVYKKIFEMGLTPIEFRVYCHLTYLESQLSRENPCFNDNQLAVDCCITIEDYELACQQLESLDLISRYGNEILIHEIKAPKYHAPVRTVKESFGLDTKRYKSLPVYQPSVYIIKSEFNGLIKIGITNSPRKRLKSIAWKHRFDVEILQIIECPAPKTLEELLHLEFKSKQVRFAGETEWFELSNADLTRISSIATTFLSLVAGEV